MDPVIEEIRRRADIVDVVGEYVSLVPAGSGRWKACCPFHNEKTPSFNVSREKGFFKCFGCLHEDEPIWTRRGLVPVRCVEPGECVLDRHGEWRSVLATEHKRGPLLAVSTRAFRGDPLRLTPDHTCLWVKREDALRSLPYLYNSSERGTRFKGAHRRYASRPFAITQGRADEMRQGDFLLFPVVPDSSRSAAPLFQPQALRPYTIGKKVQRLIALPVSERTARLYGLYLAEGSASGRSVFWTFHIDEAATLGQEVVDTLRDELGLRASLFLHPHKTTCSVVCSKVDLVAQLSFWFGKGCAGKKLPPQVLEWPRELQRALLDGYRDGDGKKATGATASVSRDLSYGLFALHIQAGLHPSMSARPAYTDASGLAHRPCWHLHANSKAGLGGWFEEAEGHLYFWSEIRSVEPLEGEHPVVDISVAGTQTFVTKMGLTHNCGVAGDIFKFVSLIENLPFGEVKKKLAERYGVPLRDYSQTTPEQAAAMDERARLKRVVATAASWFREQFMGNAGLQARDYARSRKLSRETLEAFGIGYAPDSWDAATNFLTKKFGYAASEGAAAGLLVEKEDERGKRYYDRYRHRLIFPIWDERGEVIAFGGRALEGGETGTPEAKYINSPEGILFSKSRVLYAWHKARDAARAKESLIVTEGYMDAVALHAAGFPNTVATLGTSLTQEHARLLSRSRLKSVLLCFDGDGAGMRAALRAGPLFDSLGLAVRVVRLPQQHDPDTFIQEKGREAFAQVLEAALPLAQYRIEASLGDALGGARMEREEAISQAARVIAELHDEGERSLYVGSLAQKVAQASGSLDRLATVEESIRKRVQTAQSEIRREASNQRRRESERAAVQERLREKGSGEVIPLPQREAPQDDDGHKYLQPDDGPESQGSGEVIPFTPRPSPKPRRAWVPDAEWRSKGDWKKREAPTHNSIEANLPAEEAGGTDVIAARKLDKVATGDDSGVVKAERALLAAMLGAPSLRASLSERLGAASWTRESHFEIAAHLKNLQEEEAVDPPRLIEELSPDAAKLLGHLLLEDTMETTEPHVLDDYIKRIEAHHAKQREHQNLQILLQKMMAAEAGTSFAEAVEPEDKARFEDSARQTKRLLPPES